MQFWNSLPTWARGVVMVVLLLILVYVGYKFKDYIFTSKDEREAKSKSNPVVTPNEAKGALQKIAASNNKLLRPTYSAAQYASFADQLFEAMNHTGTNNSVIQRVFESCYNAADVYSIINAYGIRQLKVLAFNDGEPGNLSQHLVSEGATGYANKGLEKRKVYFKF